MKLKRIRLVNWHIFNDHTIEIDKNTVLTGENGNGKSTLIDAIYFVLSGGDEKSFNNAANSESARSLYTYIKCKLGIEGREFKRNENEITCHIALEFVDEITNSTKTLGCVVELVGKTPNKYFYILDEMGVNDVAYIDENGVVADYETIKKLCKGHIDAMPGRTTSYKVIRTKIEDLLQLNNSESYNKLLKKAIAFRPLNNEITTFVNMFLLKDEKINIQSLKEEINSYRDIQAMINKESQKLECLDQFVGLAEEYKQNEKKINYLTACEFKKQININEAIIDKKSKDLIVCESKIDAAQKDYDREDKNVEDYSKILLNLQNQETYKVLGELKENLKKLNSDLFLENHNKKEIESSIETEQNISDDLELGFDFNKKIETRDIAGLNVLLKKYKNKIDEIKDAKTEEKINYNNEIALNNKQIKELKDAIELLKKGQNNYKEEVKGLMRLIHDELSKKYNKDIKSIPLCECFEINDKRWTNAIEGYLHNQRFDLVIDGCYFKDALNIYNKYAVEKKIYEVGLIDTTKVINLPVLENSLFSKITIKNDIATTKLKQLLGQVICVDSVDELNEYDSSITDNCMLYKNFVAKRLNPRRYEQHYIGLESQQQRINQLTKTLEAFKITNAQLLEKLNACNDVIDCIKQSRIDVSKQIEDVWKNITNISNEIELKQEQINGIEESDDLIGLENQIKHYDKLQFEAKTKRNAARLAKEEEISIRSTLNTKLEDARRVLKDEKQNYDVAIAEFDEEYFAFEKKALSNANLIFKDEKALLRNKNYQYTNDIQKGITEYYSRFEKNMGSSIGDLDKYIEKYNTIKNTDIVIFKQKATAAYENAKRSFNEKFVTTLRTKIKDAQKNLKDINKILSVHPFGLDGEVYSFVYSASKDKELGNYYRVINSDKAFNQVDLLVESMSEEDQDLIKDLFERIAMDTDDSNAQNDLERFLDYRSYMNYDIKITNKNGDEYLFSKIAKEKSGGETQTPFYVVIAACFEQLIKKNARGSSCIIIFDEAFNNMDESRIATLLSYYKELKSIQFIIGVPTNRAPLLVPTMDSCIGLVKQNNNVEIIPIR